MNKKSQWENIEKITKEDILFLCELIFENDDIENINFDVNDLHKESPNQIIFSRISDDFNKIIDSKKKKKNNNIKNISI